MDNEISNKKNEKLSGLGRFDNFLFQHDDFILEGIFNETCHTSSLDPSLIFTLFKINIESVGFMWVLYMNLTYPIMISKNEKMEE